MYQKYILSSFLSCEPFCDPSGLSLYPMEGSTALWHNCIILFFITILLQNKNFSMISVLTWIHPVSVFHVKTVSWSGKYIMFNVFSWPYSAGAWGGQEGLPGWGRQGVQGSGSQTPHGWSDEPSWSSPPLAVKRRKTKKSIYNLLSFLQLWWKNICRWLVYFG